MFAFSKNIGFFKEEDLKPLKREDPMRQRVEGSFLFADKTKEYQNKISEEPTMLPSEKPKSMEGEWKDSPKSEDKDVQDLIDESLNFVKRCLNPDFEEVDLSPAFF